MFIQNVKWWYRADFGFGMGFFQEFPGSEFEFWARSKNPENPGIPEIGIRIWKSRKNPEWKRIFLLSNFYRDLEAPDLAFKAYDYYAVISGNFSAIIWSTLRMSKNFAHSLYCNLPVKILCHLFEVSRIEIYSNIRLYILIYIKGCVYGFIGLWKVSFKGDEKMINQKENMSEN